MYAQCVKAAAVAAVAGGLLLGGPSAEAVVYHFDQVSSNGAPSIDGQLSVDVTSPNANQVNFQFFNDVGIASNIASIYFEDSLDTLASIQSITDSDVAPADDVDFVLGAQPPTFEGSAGFTVDFGVSAAPPPAHNGINDDDEWVSVLFNLTSALSLNDIVNLLLAGDLRIGLHVTGYDNDKSEWFINQPNPIPLPAGLILFLSGLAGIGALGRYKAKRRELATA